VHAGGDDRSPLAGLSGFNTTYVAGSAKSTVDYVMVRQEDKVKVRNVRVIPDEECMPKHKLLVVDMQINTTKRWHKKFEPRRNKLVKNIKAMLETR